MRRRGEGGSGRRLDGGGTDGRIRESRFLFKRGRREPDGKRFAEFESVEPEIGGPEEDEVGKGIKWFGGDSGGGDSEAVKKDEGESRGGVCSGEAGSTITSIVGRGRDMIE